MRPIVLPTLALALLAAPAAAQWELAVDAAPAAGPNAQAAQRPPGPNARAAQRTLGPNGALAQKSRLPGREGEYLTCAEARAARATPVRRGEPGYGRHLDRDGDGRACEAREDTPTQGN